MFVCVFDDGWEIDFSVVYFWLDEVEILWLCIVRFGDGEVSVCDEGVVVGYFDICIVVVCVGVLEFWLDGVCIFGCEGLVDLLLLYDLVEVEVEIWFVVDFYLEWLWGLEVLWLLFVFMLGIMLWELRGMVG